MKCPTCQQDLEEGIRFCPHDGTPLTETSANRTVATPTGQHPPSREIQLPAVVGGRYRLEAVRGGGGMAKVYRAIDITLEREVAIKLINPELRAEPEFDARFQREARIASQLADPHIVVVHDFGLDATHGPFLVMEYLQGQSLRERIQSGGPLPLKAGLQLSAQVLLALIHAHGKNIVHRDIKPDNIFLLNQSGVRLHVRVLDFGIARIYRRDDLNRAETITHAGAVLGTPRYMSPEQLAGQPVDARSDLYSAALVIHEALTGQLPYVAGKKLCELCPDATQSLQDLLDQCLKPNPAERPPTAVEVYLRLQELGKASGILLLPPGAMDRLVAARKAGEPTVPYKPRFWTKWSRRQLLVAAIVALAVVAAAIVSAALWLRPRPAAGDGESLHGIMIGDRLGELEDEPRLTHSRSAGDPFKDRQTKALLGRMLRSEDLRLTEAELRDLDVRWNQEQTLCVLLHQGKVAAVVARDRGAATARRMKVGGGIQTLYKLYPESAQTQDVRLPGGGHVEVRRYDDLGVGFEIQDLQVIAITLFPKAKQ
jgi:tRNA A-37 threonylcarbamoyl transferase component Bud32